MGTWGTRTFENDWAMDWIGDLRESQDATLVLVALRRVVDHGGNKHGSTPFWARLIGRRPKTDWLTANAATKALAAAEIVAAWLGHPVTKLPDGIPEWLQTHSPSFQPEWIVFARQAVRIVKTNSELKDLWEEGDATEWNTVVEDLERRLGMASLASVR